MRQQKKEATGDAPLRVSESPAVDPTPLADPYKDPEFQGFVRSIMSARHEDMKASMTANKTRREQIRVD